MESINQFMIFTEVLFKTNICKLGNLSITSIIIFFIYNGNYIYFVSHGILIGLFFITRRRYLLNDLGIRIFDIERLN